MKVKVLHSFWSSVTNEIVDKDTTIEVDEESETYKLWIRRGLIEPISAKKTAKKSSE